MGHVLATTGGAIFQHFFRRPGEQLRDSVALPRPLASGREEPCLPVSRRRAPGRSESADSAPTRSLPAPGEYGEATVHGTKWRGWRRSLAASGAVFAVVMAVITGLELATGSSMAGWTGHGGESPSLIAFAGGPSSKPSKHPGTGSTPSPSATRSGGNPGSGAVPQPSASSRAQTGNGSTGSGSPPSPAPDGKASSGTDTGAVTQPTPTPAPSRPQLTAGTPTATP